MKRYNITEILFLAAAVLAAFFYRYSFYLSNYYITARGIADGSDFQFYLEDPRSFAWSLKLEFFHCGNTAVLIPFLGVIYRFFGIYPGVHYFVIIMIFLSSLCCIFPYFICRRFCGKRFSYGGVFGVLLLVSNPILIKESPVVSSDLLGLFMLALVLFFMLRAVYSFKLSEDYLLAGFFLALLPFTRTVFIPLGFAGIIAFIIVVFFRHIIQALKKLGWRNKQTWGFILKVIISLFIFIIVITGYDNFIRRNSGRHISYIGHFIKDSFFQTCIGRDLNIHEIGRFGERIRTFWIHTCNFKNILWERLFQNICLHSFITKSILLGAVYLLWKRFCLIFPIIVLGVVYFASVTSYFVNYSDRYLMPLILICAVTSGFVFDELTGIFCRFKRLAVINFLMKIMIFVILLSLLGGGIVSLVLANNNFKYDVEYLKWVNRNAPSNALILTSEKINPWLVCEFAKRPVIYRAVNYNTILIDKVPYLVNDFKRLADLYGYGKGEKIWFELFKDGYRFAIIEDEFYNELNNYWLDYVNSAIKKPYFKYPVKIADYYKDSKKRIYIIDLDEDYYSDASI